MNIFYDQDRIFEISVEKKPIYIGETCPLIAAKKYLEEVDTVIFDIGCVQTLLNGRWSKKFFELEDGSMKVITWTDNNTVEEKGISVNVKVGDTMTLMRVSIDKVVEDTEDAKDMYVMSSMGTFNVEMKTNSKAGAAILIAGKK